MMALGGSTNGVLHLLALAREANVPLAVDDFNTIAKDVPLLGNLKPSGRCGNRTAALVSAPLPDHTVKVPPAAIVAESSNVYSWLERGEDHHHQCHHQRHCVRPKAPRDTHATPHLVTGLADQLPALQRCDAGALVAQRDGVRFQVQRLQHNAGVSSTVRLHFVCVRTRIREPHTQGTPETMPCSVIGRAKRR